MSIDMFTDPASDPRSEAPHRGDELATLVGFLRWQRETLERKCAGLDAGDLARRSVEPDPALVEQAWEVWRSEVAFAERFVAEAPDLDVIGNKARRGAMSLRWVLVHMVEEYARHNGHADLLRQRIDGAVGE